jgi:hypothetical protein
MEGTFVTINFTVRPSQELLLSISFSAEPQHGNLSWFLAALTLACHAILANSIGSLTEQFAALHSYQARLIIT